jgi:hypothetical protein
MLRRAYADLQDQVGRWGDSGGMGKGKGGGGGGGRWSPGEGHTEQSIETYKTRALSPQRMR